MPNDEPIYGYEVTYLRHGSGVTEAKCHCKGTLTDATRNARLKRLFKCVVFTQAFTQAQWRRCFGEGRGRF